jgi:hypothetical protein
MPVRVGGPYDFEAWDDEGCKCYPLTLKVDSGRNVGWEVRTYAWFVGFVDDDDQNPVDRFWIRADDVPLQLLLRNLQ